MNDIISRWGGEEFSILVPFLELDEVKKVGERIRKSVEKNLILKNGKNLTVSMGVSFFEVNESLDINKLNINAIVSKILEKTDDSLYKAKREGKNTVVYESVDFIDN
jgi:diguanylate cyclase (GGDEF)-like protein